MSVLQQNITLEYLMCADQIISGGETYCKPCDVGSFDWDAFKCSASLASEGRAFNSYCQSNLLPPDGCQCDDVFEDPSMEGYVKADQVYFGRGSVSRIVCILAFKNWYVPMN